MAGLEDAAVVGRGRKEVDLPITVVGFISVEAYKPSCVADVL